jgi:hypothetical protein
MGDPTRRGHALRAMTSITILLFLAIAAFFAVAVALASDPVPDHVLADRIDPGMSTTRGVRFDRNGAPRRDA